MAKRIKTRCKKLTLLWWVVYPIMHYVSAKIGEVAWVSFLVDTGAAVSLIDEKY